MPIVAGAVVGLLIVVAGAVGLVLMAYGIRVHVVPTKYRARIGAIGLALYVIAVSVAIYYAAGWGK